MPGTHTAVRPVPHAPHGAAHPQAVGWWRPPKSRPRATDDAGARHRADPPQAAPPAAARRGVGVRRVLLGVFAAACGLPALAVAVGYFSFAVPNPDDGVGNQVAVVSYADGSPLARLASDQGNRTTVPLDAVPVPVRQAVLAAQDRTFPTDPGPSLSGVLRTVYHQLRGGDGGSTIAQQYTRNTLLGGEPSLWRRYQELIVAVKISQEGKDQLLGNYLNTVYFGRGAYGVQAAARAYFGDDVEHLSVAEGAMLAGVIQSPSRWDPAVSPERAAQRWASVLDGMVSQGWLTPTARAAQRFPVTVARRAQPGGIPAGSDGHLVDAVSVELADLGINEQDLAHQGLRIVTTVDPARQHQAVDAVHSTLAGQPASLRSAAVTVDPATGDVLAYYGGEDGSGPDYARADRPAGSTVAPFVVLAALEGDTPIGLGTTFPGMPVPGLRNVGGANCARCDLKQAMTISDDVVLHALTLRVGPQRVAAAARSTGIGSPSADPSEVTVFDLASAYATIAAGGVYRVPHLVASVVTADGRVLYQAVPGGERRFDDQVARNVTEAMLDVARAADLALPDGRPVAAKTATVASRAAGQNTDAWLAGFTPTASSAVWLGADRGTPIRSASGRPIEGRTLPGAIWHTIMAEAVRGRPVATFGPFRPIGEPPSNLPPGRTARPSSRTAVTPATTGPAPAGAATGAATGGRAATGPADGAGAPVAGPR